MCETALWLSRSRFNRNFRAIRERVGRNVKILINLKANAYGHGAVAVGTFFEGKADYFSVACQKEGTELRLAGIRTPILVYNPPVEWNKAFFDAQLEPVLYHPQQVRSLSEFLHAAGLKKIKVHLKIDTGMHRSGVSPELLDEMLAALQKDKRLELVSVFSHLAAADDPVEKEFTLSQIRLFDLLSRQVKAIYPSAIRHLANSAAIWNYPEAYFDMVRPGLSIYGISPVEGEPENILQPVGQLVSRITQIRRIDKGETVGYNRQFKAERPSRIAVIPTGYGDGYKRLLGEGKAYVMINGQKAPVIGKVNMDMITVDVTDTEAEIGDRAILFGDQPHAKELAKIAQTIPYDITTSLTQRVKREWKEF